MFNILKEFLRRVPWLFLAVIFISRISFAQLGRTNLLRVRNTRNTKKMLAKSTFSCAINCMDGRVQDPVKNYIKQNYGVEFVDMVTAPGPNKILADNSNIVIVDDIKKRLEISVKKHGSTVIALVGHDDCAGNPAGKEQQIEHLRKAKETVESFGFDIEVILLWISDGWQEAELIE